MQQTKGGNEPEAVTLIAGGDVGPVRQPVDRLAELMLPTLAEADFRFCQCERTYSTRGSYRNWGTSELVGNSRLTPDHASIFMKAGFDVVSLASNHAMDAGPEAMLDTIALMQAAGIQVVGAGENIEEARRPAIMSKGNIKIAILAYISVLHPGCAAGPDLPGLAPMRAHTYYEPVDFFPGYPPNIVTSPFAEDVRDMEDDIRRAKEQADAVIVSHHWGFTKFSPKVLMNYQPIVAHAAIDAGADLILGHHPHIPQAVEVYKGKVCFYSIGNMFATGRIGVTKKASYARWNLFWEENPTMADPSRVYSMPDSCRQTIFPWITVTKDGIDEVAFIPAYINELAQPEVYSADDPAFQQAVDWMEWVSEPTPHVFRVKGNMVVVESGE